jgi:hypothetical protein
MPMIIRPDKVGKKVERESDPPRGIWKSRMASGTWCVLNDLYTSFTTFWTYPNVRVREGVLRQLRIDNEW